MIPEHIPRGGINAQICELAHRWILSVSLSQKLFQLADRLPFGISIISGFRTREQQIKLMKDPDRPATDPDLSTHCACPATGADLWPTVAVTQMVKAQFGEAVVILGLRWGGGSPVDPNTGIPSDWNHVDQGPRS